MQHSCPSIGIDIDDGAPAGPDPYPSHHRTLVRVISGGWDKLARLDPAKALGIGEGWKLRHEALYQQLHPHGLRHTNVFTAAEVGQKLL